jgi:hypothetical protein
LEGLGVALPLRLDEPREGRHGESSFDVSEATG